MKARPTSTIVFLVSLALCTTGGVERKAARLNNQANTRFEAGKLDEAVELYDEAHTRAPESPEIAYNHGNALYKQGRLEEAAAQLRRGTLCADPELRRQSFYNLGNALHDMKKLPEAAGAYRRALALDPEDRKAKINYEKTLQELQQQQQQQQQQQGQNSKQDQQQGQQGEQQPQDPQQGDQQAESQPQDPQQGQQKEEESRQDSQQETGGSQEEPPEEPAQPQMAALDSLQQGDLSPEEAIRILEAMREQERELQKERARKQVRSRRVDKDW